MNIDITNITEGNKEERVRTFEKSLIALGSGRKVERTKAKEDGTKRIGNIRFVMKSLEGKRIVKAVNSLALNLDTKLKPPKGETFFYKAQEDLVGRIVEDFGEKTKKLYSFLIGYFGLPEMRIVAKANLVHNGKVLYSPEDGQPITQKEWDKFTRSLEDFFNRNFNDGSGKRMILSATTLGKILDEMTETNSLSAIKAKRLDDLKYKGKRFDWIAQNVKNMKDTFGASFTREQQARIQVLDNSAAMRVTKVTNTERDAIKQILIDGVKNRATKSQVSQSLFDSLAGMNRDFMRVADTEIANATNEAYIQEEVFRTPRGEKVYFMRHEVIDENTCKQCRDMDGEIVLWSEEPMPTSKIKDPYAKRAMWLGSGIVDKDGIPNGTIHPYCRGGWIRYYPVAENLIGGNRGK